MIPHNINTSMPHIYINFKIKLGNTDGIKIKKVCCMLKLLFNNSFLELIMKQLSRIRCFLPGYFDKF